MRKTFAVGRKEFHQIVRDRRSLGILLLFPAFVLLLFGYALNWDVRHIALAVDDRDRSPESRALISAFVNSGYFDLAAIVDSDAELTRLMDRNDARAVLVIPPGFEEELQRQTPVSVQLLLNGDNANTATTVMGYALTIVQSEAARRQSRIGSGGPRVVVEPRIWYNPQLRSTLFLVPGADRLHLDAQRRRLDGAVASSGRRSAARSSRCGWRRSGPLRSCSARRSRTSCSRWSRRSASSSSRWCCSACRCAGRGCSCSPRCRCSWSGRSGSGLLISSVAETQQVAFQLALLASFLPTLMLSGFIFPIASMPQVLQAITRVVPARYFLTALRGILLKGVGVDVVWPDLVALARVLRAGVDAGVGPAPPAVELTCGAPDS